MYITVLVFTASNKYCMPCLTNWFHARINVFTTSNACEEKHAIGGEETNLTVLSFNESAKQSICSSSNLSYWKVNVVSVYMKYYIKIQTVELL
jgi:hypothetical protein